MKLLLIAIALVSTNPVLAQESYGTQCDIYNTPAINAMVNDMVEQIRTNPEVAKRYQDNQLLFAGRTTCEDIKKAVRLIVTGEQ